MILSTMLVAIALCGALLITPGEAADPHAASRSGMFRARPVVPKDLRWQDVGDRHYSSAFTGAYTYQRPAPLLTVSFQAGPGAPTGHFSAQRLKPNFAYQLKLCGRANLVGTTEMENGLSPEAWASYQLGHQGRWWCADCRWNASDWDLSWHLSQGHHVTGYLLFGWFVTDARGAAEVDFRVLSSYHVLWKQTQRAPGRYDGRPFTVTVARADYGYAGAARKHNEKITLYGEWETGRALPGQLRLAPGPYPVLLNLTEESFHSGGNDGGGNWAQVLEAPVDFTVTGPGDGSAGYEGVAWSPWKALEFFAGRSWEKVKTVAIEAMKPRDGR